jgi:hypothetical protein
MPLDVLTYALDHIVLFNLSAHCYRHVYEKEIWDKYIRQNVVHFVTVKTFFICTGFVSHFLNIFLELSVPTVLTYAIKC